MILLDTNAFIWSVMDDRRLGADSKALADHESVTGGAFVSAISFWEMSMLIDKCRITLDCDLSIWVRRVFQEDVIKLAPIDPEIAIDAGRLPNGIHGDPADRLIIATARALACPLLTSDTKILDYAGKGHLRAIDARL